MIIQFPSKKYKVEPANIHHIHYITSFNIANMERTLALPPKDCTEDDRPGVYAKKKKTDNSFEYNKKTCYIFKQGIKNDVVLVPGFNCSVNKRATKNELQIIANPGFGCSITEDQKEFPIYDGEAIPDNSFYYSGGIKCTDTIKAINGINSKTVPFSAGGGITMTTEGNTITLAIDDGAVKDSCEDECGNTN